MSSACVQRIISPISSSMRMRLREVGLHLHHHTTSWWTTGKQETRVNPGPVPTKFHHLWEKTCTRDKTNNRISSWNTNAALSRAILNTDGIFYRCKAFISPSFMITCCQTTVPVCSAASQRGSFNDKSWHSFQNGIFLWPCNAHRMTRYVHLISAEPYCCLLSFFCASRILRMMSARQTLEVITDLRVSVEEQLQTSATLFWWKAPWKTHSVNLLTPAVLRGFHKLPVALNL